MSQNISDAQKEDLAWATYILLRNTNTIAVLITIQGELCVRGYWKTPDKMSKDEVLDWFKERIENIGLSDVKGTLYFPQTTGYAYSDKDRAMDKSYWKTNLEVKKKKDNMMVNV
ncbi:hypothetical protein NC652_035719 [Populus alba x Populus x berolinensis]|nr:hypothetical protein NC652_035719 [Populus alba x Populus x berolinensis]